MMMGARRGGLVEQTGEGNFSGNFSEATFLKPEKYTNEEGDAAAAIVRDGDDQQCSGDNDDDN